MILETWGSSNAKRKCKMGELTGASCLLKRCAQCCRLKTSRQLCQVPTMKWQAKFQEWHLQMASAGPDQEGHDTLKECWRPLDEVSAQNVIITDVQGKLAELDAAQKASAAASEKKRWMKTFWDWPLHSCFFEKFCSLVRNCFVFESVLLLDWPVGLTQKDCCAEFKKIAVLTCFLAASFQSNAFAWPYEDFCCYFVGLYVNIQIWTFQLSTNL